MKYKAYLFLILSMILAQNFNLFSAAMREDQKVTIKFTYAPDLENLSLEQLNNFIKSDDTHKCIAKKGLIAYLKRIGIELNENFQIEEASITLENKLLHAKVCEEFYKNEKHYMNIIKTVWQNEIERRDKLYPASDFGFKHDEMCIIL